MSRATEILAELASLVADHESAAHGVSVQCCIDARTVSGSAIDFAHAVRQSIAQRIKSLTSELSEIYVPFPKNTSGTITSIQPGLYWSPGGSVELQR